MCNVDILSNWADNIVLSKEATRSVILLLNNIASNISRAPANNLNVAISSITIVKDFIKMRLTRTVETGVDVCRIPWRMCDKVHLSETSKNLKVNLG